METTRKSFSSRNGKPDEKASPERVLHDSCQMLRLLVGREEQALLSGSYAKPTIISAPPSPYVGDKQDDSHSQTVDSECQMSPSTGDSHFPFHRWAWWTDATWAAFSLYSPRIVWNVDEQDPPNSCVGHSVPRQCTYYSLPVRKNKSVNADLNVRT
jgi:hypothetical protein